MSCWELDQRLLPAKLLDVQSGLGLLSLGHSSPAPPPHIAFWILFCKADSLAHLLKDLRQLLRAVFEMELHVQAIGGQHHAAGRLEDSFHFLHEAWDVKPVDCRKRQDEVHRVILEREVFRRAHPGGGSRKTTFTADCYSFERECLSTHRLPVENRPQPFSNFLPQSQSFFFFFLPPNPIRVSGFTGFFRNEVGGSRSEDLFQSALCSLVIPQPGCLQLC